jgi:cell division septum initiation protein DivIVA
MTTINTSATDVTFRVRPLGFDRGEVQAFIGNLLNDYAQVTRELDRLRNEMASLRDFTPDRSKPLPEVTPVAAPVAPVSAASSSAREVERILAGAERIADEIRARAQEESTTAVREAEMRVAALTQEGDLKGAEILKEAQARAAEIVEGAAREADMLERQSMAIRAHCAQMRTAIKSASDAAALALKQITAVEEGQETALPGRR